MTDDIVAANKDLIARCVEVLWNQGALDRAGEFLHANVRRHHERNPDADLHGLQAVRDRLADLHRALTGARIEIVRMFGEGDRVMVHLRSQSESPVWTVTALVRVAEGRVAECWLIADTLGLLQQQGAVRRFA